MSYKEIEYSKLEYLRKEFDGHGDFDGKDNFTIFAVKTLMGHFMDTGGKSERILWTILANLARAVLLVSFVVFGAFPIVIFNPSGDFIKDLFNFYVPVELIFAGVFMLLIWKWTPKKQRWIWVLLYFGGEILLHILI